MCYLWMMTTVVVALSLSQDLVRKIEKICSRLRSSPCFLCVAPAPSMCSCLEMVQIQTLSRPAEHDLDQHLETHFHCSSASFCFLACPNCSLVRPNCSLTV